jgi:hypothetical protein
MGCTINTSLISRSLANGSSSLVPKERNQLSSITNIRTNILGFLNRIRGENSLAVGLLQLNATDPIIGANSAILLHPGGIQLHLMEVPTLASRLPQHVLTTCSATGVARSMVLSANSPSIPMRTLTRMLNGLTPSPAEQWHLLTRDIVST